MDCSFPPPLTSEQISEAIDGQAEPSTYDHLAQCSSCAVRLAAAQELEGRLNRALYRWDCPTSRQLSEYYNEMLDPPEADAIRHHLAQCVRCGDEFARLRAFMTAPSPERGEPARPAVTPRRPRLGELVARLLPRTQTQALRGGGSGPIMAEAGEVQIILDTRPGKEGQVTLDGQVIAPDQDRWTGALVLVRQSGELRHTATLDDLGGFHCQAVPAAKTEVRIAPVAGQMVVVPEVDLSS